MKYCALFQDFFWVQEISHGWPQKRCSMPSNTRSRSPLSSSPRQSTTIAGVNDSIMVSQGGPFDPTTASLGTKHVDEGKKAMETGGRAMQLIRIPVVVYLTSICVLNYAKRERKRNLQSILCHTFLCSCYIFVSAMPNQRRLQWFN